MTECFGKLKIRHVGEFEIHTFEELESIVNDKNSIIRQKFEGMKK
jgi:hypothetical protein